MSSIQSINKQLQHQYCNRSSVCCYKEMYAALGLSEGADRVWWTILGRA